jgi:hypothetical protein
MLVASLAHSEFGTEIGEFDLKRAEGGVDQRKGCGCWRLRCWCGVSGCSHPAKVDDRRRTK